MRLLRPSARPRARALVVALSIGAGVLVPTVSVAAPASAAVHAVSSGAPTAAQVRFGALVVRVAALYKGRPYVYGGNGPRYFDCSGYTRYVYKRLGKYLPRTAAQQYYAVRHISRAHAIPGDLVFFVGYGGIYHVAIYAGHNRIWHAPYPGTRVRLERIWTSAVRFGRK